MDPSAITSLTGMVPWPIAAWAVHTSSCTASLVCSGVKPLAPGPLSVMVIRLGVSLRSLTVVPDHG